MSEYILSESALTELCHTLKNTIRKGYVVLLRGDLGSGKTTLVRSFVAFESKEQANEVTSPTFSLAQAYKSQDYGAIYHYDIYRKDMQDMLELGLLEMLEQDGLHFVEWGDEALENILRQNGFNVMSITINTNAMLDHRIYKVAL
ncbi:tRNA (adenosine(37)-N6)-threonylcarbamoyltransferase complex ATPase subunit type 1 TsaE [Helicobacter sp. MIT 21-1697]|uniref:tRNA (adenosine(37)-N6)-threonylcarbamoyltransferase complex ATPase subunit type 1 TsaE n=1 Tax=Helicobacter sp. MIT 21-1697 TaxID=2993733 RepID=UPI00224A5A8F|nr:tRNA (adenosine(37)-N6)-threonylcarbamoyltransferase complex ATPase subunit type 1 TsaE [Helicobacter sp. MIT 21-1697]MCX2717724.1 tRNA (adenosine(37)-N6)-threonylcarbamoyltransferase complex ATPase subunit type 1 TsaE [Helicobacter sp. MIT 21-1697]